MEEEGCARNCHLAAFIDGHNIAVRRRTLGNVMVESGRKCLNSCAGIKLPHRISGVTWTNGRFIGEGTIIIPGKEEMGWPTGLEPATSRTTIWGSTIEL